MAAEFQVSGHNAAAPFTLKLHRGDGMTLLAMDWKVGKPPQDFVGFAIEYKEPNGDRFYALKNRLGFRAASGQVNPNILSTMLSPIQKFRWVHFPRNAELLGEFIYRVKPVFMNDNDELSYGEEQEEQSSSGVRLIRSCLTSHSPVASFRLRHSWIDTRRMGPSPSCCPPRQRMA